MLPGFSVRYLVQSFPWVTGGDFVIVDVGGGLGHVSQALVDHNPTVKCIVEDSQDVVQQGQEITSARFGDRITFQAHDFFQEQPVKGADVYLLRLVLHDWSDKYSSLIIKALIPALKAGTKIVVNDRVIPGHGQASYLAEREARYVPQKRGTVSNEVLTFVHTATTTCICLPFRMPKSAPLKTGPLFSTK